MVVPRKRLRKGKREREKEKEREREKGSVFVSVREGKRGGDSVRVVMSAWCGAIRAVGDSLSLLVELQLLQLMEGESKQESNEML
jgi:hypothetical protein